ncbi:putative oxidoreductase YcjS [Allorhodopirellula solitaria]|uniref:Putative oxidoreductase YcjS n=2 Tax=Allorhodopirellula solitaria TaxID=2527987 RepID=A0A5C5YE92_9BACT|nr:putative oxidoreductase YcjS [Allorhodopirellula solitaria]
MALGSTVALGGSAVVAAGEAAVADPRANRIGVHAGGSDRIRIGLIGCGARGKAAAVEAIAAGSDATNDASAASGVELVAMADTQSNQLQTAYRTIRGRQRHGVEVAGRRFIGPDGWRGVLASDVDLVILATPPEFRALHFENAVEAGKHVFMECPIASDAAGVQRIAQAGVRARSAGLAVAVGHQRRHELRTRQCVERLRGGMLGELTYARTFGGDLHDDRQVHRLDIVNWVLDQTPRAARGFGGVNEDNVPYHLVEYTYETDFPLISQYRKHRGGRQHGEYFHGTLGSCDMAHGSIRDRSGKVIWRSEAKEIRGKGWQRQFNELIASLRAGEKPWQLDQAIASTNAVLLGQAAIQSGQRTRQL